MAGAKTHPDTLQAVQLVLDGYPIDKVAKSMGVHRTTIQRAMNRLKKKVVDKRKA